MSLLPAFFILFFLVTSSSSSASEKEDDINTLPCATGCECSAWEGNLISVLCEQGGLDDELFSRILAELPAQDVGKLEVLPSPARKANRFRWTDNLNKLSQLRILRLVDCGIPSLSRQLRLPQLRILDLRSNRIGALTLSMWQWAGAPLLEHLDLSSNRLTVLPTGLFARLPHLQGLHLSRNNISDVSASVLQGVTTLRSLHLAGNPIPVDQLSALIQEASPTLEALDLGGSSLTPTALSNLGLSRLGSRLRHLGLSALSLRRVPVEVLRDLRALESLDLSHNMISRVEQCDFCSAPNLTRLSLASNLLGARESPPFEAGAFQGTSMDSLDLSHNHFEHFDPDWLLLGAKHQDIGAKLRELKLSGTAVRSWPRKLLVEGPKKLPSLRSLHLAHSAFNSWPQEVATIVSFHHLNQWVQAPLFSQLHELNVSSNHLASVPASKLSRLLPNLRLLDLSHNFLSSLNPEDALWLDSVRDVRLHHNQWDCGCAGRPLQRHMRTRKSRRHELLYSLVRCSKPAALNGHAVLTAPDTHDCALLFGSGFGLSAAAELLLLMSTVVGLAALLAIIASLFYCLRERRFKGTYVTREHSRTPLTMGSNSSASGGKCPKSTTTCASSTSSSSADEENISLTEDHHHHLHHQQQQQQNNNNNNNDSSLLRSFHSSEFQTIPRTAQPKTLAFRGQTLPSTAIATNHHQHSDNDHLPPPPPPSLYFGI